MNTEGTDRTRSEEGCQDVRLLAAKDALRSELRPIDVPENTEFLLSPSDPEYASSFARVRVRSYEDLQTLGFVPRRLAEEKVRQAIAADDREVYELASRMPRQSSGDCGCSESPTYASTSRGSPIRTAYNSIRKRHNPTLSRVLADHYGSQITWDAAVTAIARKWTVAVKLNPEIILVLLGDITINKNATLAVAPNSKSLLAWNIWIHTTGRLVGQGSYLKIWANSVNRFPNFLNIAAVEAARKIAPVWSLAE